MKKFMKDISKDLYRLIIGATAIFIFGFLKDLITSKPFLTTFWYFLNFSIPFWVILIVVVLVILLKKGNIKFFVKEEELKQPDFLQYTQDHIKNFDWKWRWGLDQYYQQWNIISLKPLCPECSNSCTIENYNNLNGTIRCPNCELIRHVSPSTKSDVELIIHEKAENGSFPKKSI